MRAPAFAWLSALACVLLVGGGCVADPASAYRACDDLRADFADKSDSLGCGLGAGDYQCTALGGGTCDISQIEYCRSAITDAPDCTGLRGAHNCVLTCDGM